MSSYPEAAQPLVELEQTHDSFIGIDSDGCALEYEAGLISEFEQRS